MSSRRASRNACVGGPLEVAEPIAAAGDLEHVTAMQQAVEDRGAGCHPGPGMEFVGAVVLAAAEFAALSVKIAPTATPSAS